MFKSLREIGGAQYQKKHKEFSAKRLTRSLFPGGFEDIEKDFWSFGVSEFIPFLLGFLKTRPHARWGVPLAPLPCILVASPLVFLFLGCSCIDFTATMNKLTRSFALQTGAPSIQRKFQHCHPIHCRQWKSIFNNCIPLHVMYEGNQLRLVPFKCRWDFVISYVFIFSAILCCVFLCITISGAIAKVFKI